ncbi:MAG TPA: hypothetical protein VNP92_26125 [Actinophytocola sp.]|nr:hypothetical protein [Actinophytocola sp.]
MLSAERFGDTFPVLNMVLGLGVVLLIVGLVVFAKPVGRLLGRLNLKVMQALGMADRDPDDR